MTLLIWYENKKVYKAHVNFHFHCLSIYIDGKLILYQTGMTDSDLNKFIKKVKTFKKANL